MKKYPDISVLIKQKAEHRRRMASLPFKEKVKIAFSLSERHKIIRAKRASTKNGHGSKGG